MLILCSSEDEMVRSLDDIYDVGTFVHILEMGQSDRDSRIRMIVKGIRRQASHSLIAVCYI